MDGIRCFAGVMMISIVCGGLAAGCAGDGDGQRADRGVLNASDFADPAIVREPETAAVEVVEAEEVEEDVVVSPGSPAGMVVGSVSTAEVVDVARVVVDEKVGQINGEPVYAGEYLSRMEARLRADARRMAEYEWLLMTERLIEEDLKQYVRDRLLSAEFRRSIPPEQRLGLRYFFEQIRDQQRLLSGGSEQLANRTLLETEGMTLDEMVRSTGEREFRFAQLNREIFSKVHVSRRDIEQYYRQNLDKYAPAPTAVIRAIVVRLEEPEKIEGVEAGIAVGEDTQSLAEEYSILGGERGVYERLLSRDGYAETEFFDNEDVNAAAAMLDVGECSEMVTVGRNGWWLCLEEIEVTEATPLYEVQEQIERALRARQYQELYTSYFAELEDRSNLTQQSLMVERLVDFAHERFYLPAQRAEASGGL